MRTAVTLVPAGCIVTAFLTGCGSTSSAAPTAIAPARAWRVLIPASSPLNLDHPSGIAVDGKGNVLVADTWNNRIVKLSPSGSVLARWGREGSGLGQFKRPDGVAVDSAGKVYVADTSNNRVEVLTPTGQGLRQWSVPYPAGIAVGPGGDVYATTGQLVERFNLDGRLLGKVDQHDPNVGTSEIQVDRAGNVYVLATRSTPSGQSGGNVSYVLEYSSTLKQAVDSSSGGNCPISGVENLRSFALDTANNLYYDFSYDPMEKCSPAGKLVLKGGKFGMDSWAGGPDGNLYGLTTGGRAIVKVSPSLRQLARWVPGGASPAGAVNAPDQVAVDRAGNIYVAPHPGNPDHPRQANLIQKFSSTGRPMASWHAVPHGNVTSPAYLLLAVDRQNNLDVLVADSNTGAVVEQFSPTGKLLRVSGNVGVSAGITLDGQGNLLLSDFQGPGRRLSPSLAPLPPGPVARLAGCFLAADRGGNVYVGDSCQQNTVVRKIAPSGKELARWTVGDLYGLAVDPAGNMYMTLSSGMHQASVTDEVDELSPSGHFLHAWGAGVKPGLFTSPEGVAITPQGQVLVADSGNDRIQELSAGR